MHFVQSILSDKKMLEFFMNDESCDEDSDSGSDEDCGPECRPRPKSLFIRPEPFDLPDIDGTDLFMTLVNKPTSVSPRRTSDLPTDPVSKPQTYLPKPRPLLFDISQPSTSHEASRPTSPKP